MKALTRFLLTAAILCVGINVGSQAIKAVEMNVDVGIEFTEIEPEPEPEPPKPSEPPKKELPITKPTPPRLPQTGETIGKSSMVVGGVIVLGSTLFWWRKRKEVNR